MKFVDFKEKTYYRGGYIPNNIYVNVDDISRVVECVDDYSCTNVITKDGKIHTILEKYSDVVNKIVQCNVDED